MNILLIDASKDARDMFAVALQKIEANTSYFRISCCEEAFDKASGKLIPIPDYIFLDIDMPVMEGYSCLKMIMSSVHFKGIPVVVCATVDYYNNIEFLLRHGAVSSLNKSENFLMFCARLKEIIRPEV